MFNKKIITTLALMTAQASFAKENLKSPYFIDGIHCSGVEVMTQELRDNLQNSYHHRSEEGYKRDEEIMIQQGCEAIFKRFDVEKLTWMTQEDFELLQYQLDNSNEFREITLSLKKSELKNHVHLFADIKEYEPQNRYEVDFSSGLLKGIGDESDRVNTEIGVRYLIGLKGPSSFPKWEIFGSRAISQAETAPEIKGDVEIPENDKLAIENHSMSSYQFGYIIGFPWRTQGALQHYIGFNLIGNKLTNDELSTSTLQFRTGFRSKNKFKSILGTYTSDYFILHGSDGAFASDRIVEESEKRHGERNSLYAGLNIQIEGDSPLEIKVAAMRSLSMDLSYVFEEKIRYKFSEVFGIQPGIGFWYKQRKNSQLLQERFLPSDLTGSKFYVTLETQAKLFGTDNHLLLESGVHTYETDSGDSSENRISSDGLYSSLYYKLNTNSFITKLGFTYGQRVL